MRPTRVDYGLDAPPVVRNLLLVAALGLGLWLAAAVHLWTGAARLSLGGTGVRVVVAPAAFSVGLACLAMALWMIWWSRVGKVRQRERLLDTLTWTGAERVLDVGCGRGLMLLGAAKRLRNGQAVGIDLWRRQDLGQNRPGAVWTNAALEGVSDRVALETADMRALPFPDASFDLVVSQAAVHNLSQTSDRARALREISRVLRPGGRLLLADIRHLGEYAGVLRAEGLEVRIAGSVLARALLRLVTFGALRPGVLRGRRPE